MKINNEWKDYQIIATGDGEKLERWKDVVLLRPDPQVIWHAQKPLHTIVRPDARYLRSSTGGGHWEYNRKIPDEWKVSWRDLTFSVKPMGFKHTGLFPEQAANWAMMIDLIKNANRPINVLNLFAYTGGATLAAKAAGADVTHVDSVKQVVTWSRENMERSGLEGVRWIVEDALKFVNREVRRGNRYDGIILDPPAYGRGANGEKWVLEENIGEMLECCAKLLDPDKGFLVLNLYSMGLSALLSRTALRQAFGSTGKEEAGELYFADRNGKELPLGTFCRFTRK